MEPHKCETAEHDAAASGLPEPVLINILRPQHDRLACAALVCKSWAAAAIAATTALTVSGRSSPPASSEAELDAGLSAFLQRLPGLNLLSLRHRQASDAALAQLSCLQQLQDCTLRCPRMTPAVLAHLTVSLTSLTLTGGKGVLQEGSLPAAGWPHLKELSVAQRLMQPALLARLTTLERLSLKSCRLKTRMITVSTTLNAKTAGVQLLTALAQLMNLRKLNLTNIMLNDVGDYSGAVQPDGVVPGRLSPFSALTASSQLESLVLAYTDTHKGDRPIQPLPQGAVAVMFPPGRQLNALTELVLDAMDPDLVLHLEASNLEPEYTVTRDPFYGTSCMEGSELDSLLAACPKLQHLTLNCVLQRGCGQLQRFLFDAKSKLQLSYLCLGGFCITDTEAAAVATITGLQELELHNAPELTPYGIKHLTELQQLTKLRLDAVGLKRGIECFNMPNSTMGAVWQQLQQQLPDIREQQAFMEDSDDPDAIWGPMALGFNADSDSDGSDW